MNKITIFVYTNDCKSLKTIEVSEDQKVGHLIKEVVPELAKQKDFHEDVEIYLEDSDDDLDKGLTIKEAGIKNGDHLFIGRCKKVKVNINYAGKPYSLEVSPAVSAKVLKTKAVHYFGIDEVSAAELLLWHNKEPLDARLLIGSLTDYPSCGVDLVLATKNDINGDLSYDLFQNHTKIPEFLSGEIEGRWGINNLEIGPLWPISIFWVQSSTENKYYFKFDFSNYPKIAPTSVIWDVDNKCPLDPSKRPKNTKRAIQAFKVWGKECCYLPCDRLAIQGHGNWSQLHPNLIWNPNTDTFLKYLNELYQILNP